MNFLVSCISTKHSMLKEHWVQSKEDTSCPLTAIGSRQKPKDDQGGLLCLIDETGQPINSIVLPMPAGMTFSDKNVMVASIDAVHEVTPDLSTIQRDLVSLPAFNMLHSMSRSKNGYLVASTGLDAILEFTRGGDLLWSWWATEHGFALTPTGEERYLDTSADYRGVKYGTLAHTTHVNSTAELADGSVLASLFHQGMIIRINREDGSWQPILEGLDHPHAIRILADDYFTIADTARGRALLIHIKDGKGHIEAEVQADTTWLQDCTYDQHHDRWILVDGKNSRITLRGGTAGDKDHHQLNLNPEWRLYEALPLH